MSEPDDSALGTFAFVWSSLSAKRRFMLGGVAISLLAAGFGAGYWVASYIADIRIERLETKHERELHDTRQKPESNSNVSRGGLKFERIDMIPQMVNQVAFADGSKSDGVEKATLRAYIRNTGKIPIVIESVDLIVDSVESRRAINATRAFYTPIEHDSDISVLLDVPKVGDTVRMPFGVTVDPDCMRLFSVWFRLQPPKPSGPVLYYVTGRLRLNTGSDTCIGESFEMVFFPFDWADPPPPLVVPNVLIPPVSESPR